MFGRLPAVGQWHRVLIRASQFTVVMGILVALTALYAPHKFNAGIGLAVQQQPQRWIAGLAMWLVLLLYAWTRQAMMVSRVVNDVYAHVRQYANDYDVLMRSVLRRNEFTAPEHINTLDELTRFIRAMMQQAIRDQQQLTECTVALGEERLQRVSGERQTQYIRGGVSRVLHDGKDIHNDIIYLLEDVARTDDAGQREVLCRRVGLLQARLLRIIHLQLNFFPGEAVRKALESGSHFDLRQTVFSAYVERLWRFYDAPGYEALPRELAIPAVDRDWQWRVRDLCARIDNVGVLKGNPHDLWLCIDNMVFNAIDALSRASQQQLQPLLAALPAGVVPDDRAVLPALLLRIGKNATQNRIEISLCNRGPKIAPELLAGNQIWQLRATHSEEGGSHRGRGIGLYCIKQIIDAGYGGDVVIGNVSNTSDKCALQLEFSDGKITPLHVYLQADADDKPLIALGDEHAARTALLPGAELAVADGVADGLVSVTVATHRAAVAVYGDIVVVVDPRDARAPRWYALGRGSALRFFPIDQRGVEISLSIPVSKLVVAG